MQGDNHGDRLASYQRTDRGDYKRGVQFKLQAEMKTREMKKNVEIPIGGIGIVEGQRVMVKEYMLENSCDDCCFGMNHGYSLPCPAKKCDGKRRTDKKHVYFVRDEQNNH